MNNEIKSVLTILGILAITTTVLALSLILPYQNETMRSVSTQLSDFSFLNSIQNDANKKSSDVLYDEIEEDLAQLEQELDFDAELTDDSLEIPRIDISVPADTSS